MAPVLQLLQRYEVWKMQKSVLEMGGNVNTPQFQ